MQKGAGRWGGARPHLVDVTAAQLLHFLEVDLGLGLALLPQPPSTTLPVQTKTAAEDEDARDQHDCGQGPGGHCRGHEHNGIKALASKPAGSVRGTCGG